MATPKVQVCNAFSYNGVNYPAISWTWIASPNYTAGRYLRVDHFTPHHGVLFNLGALDATFVNPARQASSHYGLHGTTGRQYVSEGNTAWTEGNAAANASGVTVEQVNAWGEPDWGIAEDTFTSTARLCADVCIRHDLGIPTYHPWNNFDLPKNVYHHRDLGRAGYSLGTRCPGEWFIANTDRFIQLAQMFYKIGTGQISLTPVAPPPPPVEFEWKQYAERRVMKCMKQPTKLLNFETGVAVKDFNKDDQIVIFGEGKRKDKTEWFLMTEYSFTAKIKNGFQQADMSDIEIAPVDPAPEPPPVDPPKPEPEIKLVWTKYDEVKKMECHSVPTCLWNFGVAELDKLTPTKEFFPGDVIDIYGECMNETLGEKFFVTEWSFENGKTNGFRLIDMIDVVIPEPEPHPEPEPEPTPEPEPDNEYPNWFIGFLKKLIEFLTSLFTKQ